jgi:hypothetical protein
MANYANPNHPGRGLLSRAVEHKFSSNTDMALNDQGEWVYAPYDAHSYENTTEYIGQTVSRARKTLLVSKLIVARAVEFSL